MNLRRTYRRADGPLSPSKVSFLRKSLNQQYHVAMDRMEGKPVARRLNLNSDAYKPIHSGLFITGRTFPQRYEREQPREQRQYEPKQVDPRNAFEDDEPPEPVDFQERLKQIRSRTDQIVAENSNSFSQEPEEESPPRPRVHFSSFHDEDTFEEEEEQIQPKEEPVPVEPVPIIEEEEDENAGLDFYQMFEKFKARTEKMLGEGAAAPAKQSNPSPEQKPKPKQESPVTTPTREYLQNPSRSDDITTRITDRLEAFKRRAAQAIEVDTVEPEEDIVDTNDAIYLEEEETLDPLADVEEEDDQY